jgi:hypothetical protein
LATALLEGCAANLEYAKAQGVMQISPDTFEVFSEDHRGIFGSDASNQRYVVDEANTFAEKQGMVAVPVEARSHRVGILGDWGWAYYKFKLLPKSERLASKQFSEIQFEGDARMSNNFLATRNKTSASSSSGPATAASLSLYDELLKLDELRRRGILTESEFEAQKKKLLESR